MVITCCVPRRPHSNVGLATPCIRDVINATSMRLFAAINRILSSRCDANVSSKNSNNSNYTLFLQEISSCETISVSPATIMHSCLPPVPVRRSEVLQCIESVKRTDHPELNWRMGDWCAPLRLLGSRLVRQANRRPEVRALTYDDPRGSRTRRDRRSIARPWGLLYASRGPRRSRRSHAP